MALIKWIVNRFRTPGLAAGTAILAGGTAVGQLVTIIASPIISRVYHPEDLGIFSAYASIFTILLTINSLRYEFAVPLAKDEDTAGGLVAISLILIIISSILFAIIFAVGGGAISGLLNTPLIEGYLWLVAPALFFAGINQVLGYWLVWKRAFAALSYSRLAQTVGQSILQIGIGIVGPGPLGLIIGQTLGQAAGMLVQVVKLRHAVKYIRLDNWQGLISKYRDFPLYTTWSSLIDVAGSQLPAILFISFFGLDRAGFLSLAMRVVAIPAALLGQAIAQAIYPVLSEKKNDMVALKTIVERTASILSVISVSAYSPLILYGPRLASIALGSQWGTTGYYASILAVEAAVMLVSSPLSVTLLIFGKQRQSLYFTIAVTVLRVGSILLAAQSHTAEFALGLYTIAGSIVDLVFLAVVMNLVAEGIASWLWQMRWFIATTVILVAVLNILRNLIPEDLAMIATIISFGVSGLWFLQRFYRNGTTDSSSP